MSNPASACSASVRRAEECDLSAILALLLTSFRQFPLFAFLYAPLDHDKDRARDTVFFWRRRVLLDLLDPWATILVAEVPVSLPPTTTTCAEDADAVTVESWRMLEWVTHKGKLSQSSKLAPGKMVVGFAIWKDRPGHGAGRKTGGNETARASWISRLRSTYFSFSQLFALHRLP
jgi:hypothetical protein